MAKIVIDNQERVDGGSNFEYPGQRWVIQLVSFNCVQGQRISVECSRSKPVKYYVGRLPKGLEEYQLK